MQAQQQSGSFFDGAKTAAGFAIFMAKIFSLPVELLLHGDVGERYIGFCGGFSFLLLLFFPVFFPHSSAGPVYALLAAFVIRCLIHRGVSLWRWWRGTRVGHSRRPGTPHLQRLLPHWQEGRVRRLEPGIVLLLGLALFWLTKPLGVYLIFAGIGLIVCLALSQILLLNRARDMNDAALEQQYSAERFRELQGRQ
jgi:hypothetical protein